MDCVDFSSNDYLGLRFNKKLQDAYCAGISQFGIGSGGSPLVCGYDEIKKKFEQEFSAFVAQEKSLLLNSGYVANLSLFSTYLVNESVSFFVDKSCHASIYDALSLRSDDTGKISRYKHGDMNHLDFLLAQSDAKHKVIVSEGIFSMTGMQADIKSLVELKHKYNSALFIDDAHCIGIKGNCGQGSSSYSDEIDVVISPLGKSFAMQGAMLSGSKLLIDNIVQSARPYIYSTSVGSGLVSALREALFIIKNAGMERKKLQNNIVYFNKLKISAGYKFIESNSAIQFLVTECPKLALLLFEKLKQENIFCYPMRQPTVTKKQTGLRFVLSAAHDSSHIEKLFFVLSQDQ